MQNLFIVEEWVPNYGSGLNVLILKGQLKLSSLNLQNTMKILNLYFIDIPFSLKDKVSKEFNKFIVEGCTNYDIGNKLQGQIDNLEITNNSSMQDFLFFISLVTMNIMKYNIDIGNNKVPHNYDNV